MFSTLLVKLVFLISLNSGVYLPATYQALLLCFAILIQLVISTKTLMIKESIVFIFFVNFTGYWHSMVGIKSSRFSHDFHSTCFFWSYSSIQSSSKFYRASRRNRHEVRLDLKQDDSKLIFFQLITATVGNNKDIYFHASKVGWQPKFCQSKNNKKIRWRQHFMFHKEIQTF